MSSAKANTSRESEPTDEIEDEDQPEPAFTGPRSTFVEREPRKFHFSARVWDDVEPLETFQPANVRLVHDAEDLYVRYADGRVLSAGEQLVVTIRPRDGEERWRIVVGADRSIATTQPEGYAVAPHCRARFESDARGPRVLVSIPFCEFVRETDLGGTPFSGTRWGFSVQRTAAGETPAPNEIEITFVGGPQRCRVELPEWEAPYFGVNLLRFAAKTAASKDMIATLTPSPAEYLRAMNPAHVKFRLAKAGGYRIRLRLPKEPDVEAASDDEEPTPGEASCAFGTVFTLPDIWQDLLAMEEDIEAFKRAAKDQATVIGEDAQENIGFFESMVLQADGFRMPRTREKMAPSFFELIKNVYAEARESLASLLPDVAAARPMAVEAAALDMKAILATDSQDEAPAKAAEAAEAESPDQPAEDEPGDAPA